ncbi:type II secretion system protein [Bacillaceae bacterium Marseille-Q3522]|nr:type II secretion system protein [Bacillaceae bacterium Marseille-Q3522]
MLKKKLRKYCKNERGLTLVELLAVIVILGIVAAIAVPSIGGIIDKSRDDATVAEALQIINAAKMDQATSDATSWDQDALSDYLSSVDDDEYSVGYANNQYTITGHPAVTIVNEELGTTGTSVSEDQLIDYSGN